MNEEIEILKKKVIALQKRNLRVEADKAWETSSIRIFSITLITYIVAAFVLYLIGAKNFLLNAFVPTIGFFLSTQSLPLIKKWWIANYFRKEKDPTIP